MKNNHPVITLLGSNSGRNLGDAAILAAVMDMLADEMPSAQFLVPTTHPAFTRKHYSDKYNVTAVNVMPWTGSIRLAGIPTINCLRKSDVALICDGIIFGKKLFNPLFNFLITLVFLLPFAKIFNCRLCCYSCGIGPFSSFWSRLFAKWVINASDLVIMRENDSRDLAQKIGVTRPVQVTGDAAFLNQVESEERAVEIMKMHDIDPAVPIFGINVTKYIDSWLPPDQQVSDKSDFLNTLAQGINGARDHTGFQPIIFSTQPMDLEFCKHLADLTKAPVIHNGDLLSHDIQAVMRKCHLFIGMRFHSLVLASATGVPIIGLVYAPKVRGFMRLLNCENYSLELVEVSSDRLTDVILEGWNRSDRLKQQQQIIVDELKKGSRQAAVEVRKTYFPGLAAE